MLAVLHLYYVKSMENGKLGVFYVNLPYYANIIEKQIIAFYAIQKWAANTKKLNNFVLYVLHLYYVKSMEDGSIGVLIAILVWDANMVYGFVDAFHVAHN